MLVSNVSMAQKSLCGDWPINHMVSHTQIHTCRHPTPPPNNNETNSINNYYNDKNSDNNNNNSEAGKESWGWLGNYGVLTEGNRRLDPGYSRASLILRKHLTKHCIDKTSQMPLFTEVYMESPLKQ